MKFNSIVLNWNESHVSVDSVKLLLEENIDVIVVDNGSEDASEEKFKSFGERIKYIRLNSNYGSSIGRNMGIQLLEHRYTFLIDGDILYVPGTIAAYVKILDQYPDAGCVGYFDYNKRLTEGWKHGTDDKLNADTKITSINEIGEWYPMAWTQYGLFRSEVLKKYQFVTLSPFNQYGYGYEDDWLYKRMKLDGCRSLHVNKPYYYHDAHFGIRELKRKKLNDMMSQRAAVFHKHWGKGTLSQEIIDSLEKVYFPYCNISEADVVMLSYTKNEQIYKMTCDSINSLIKSENNIHFNIFLVETNQNFFSEFPNGYNAKVIIPKEPFHYNKFMNIGLGHCVNDFVVMVNNDIMFENEWFSKISSCMIEHSIDSASPYNPKWFKNTIVPIDVWHGYEVGKQLFGHCIVTKRNVLSKIGNFDEKFEFWYQDNDYGMQLQKHGIKHALIKKSIVHHIGEVSHPLFDKSEHERVTLGMKKVFDEKYKI